MDNKQNLQKLDFKISGMKCQSCEILIERKFKKVNGVENANVDHKTCTATLWCTKIPDINELNNAVRDEGYSVATGANQLMARDEKNSPRDYAQIGAIVLIVMAVYFIFREFNLLPQNIGISENMSYGIVFLIGLVAAFSSCLAVTGGLLLAVTGKYAQQHGEKTGLQKLKPHLYFNSGRIISYTVFGGIIGAVGSLLTLSPKTTGIVTIVVSLIMIVLGLKLLNLLPSLSRLLPGMPKFLAHKIYDIANVDRPSTPFILGAGTFFLPCGFTQALQLYALSKGDVISGALTMFLFSLGTLPALLSLGALSSFSKGSLQQYFIKFAGVVVILLGLYNTKNGLTLTGNPIGLASIFKTSIETEASQLSNVRIENGVQIAEMKIMGLEYEPAQFVVEAGRAVEWRIDGNKAVGCGQVLVAPKLRINEYIPKKQIKTIRFTPTEPGIFKFSCSMGMTTRGAAFKVIENTDAGKVEKAAVGKGEKPSSPQDKNSTGCNPETANCLVQELTMEISQERGFYLPKKTVKKGIPVRLKIKDRVALGGCMSTLIVPDYDVATPLKVGENIIEFTPTETGMVPVTCAMGSVMATLEVVD